jgi:hypothetical protein
MALAGSQVQLGVALAAASGSVDPVAVAGWMAVANAFITWAVAAGNIKVIGSPVLGADATDLMAAGPAVSGTGQFTAPDFASLGALLALSSGSVAPQAIAAWLAVAKAFSGWVFDHAQVDPSALVANPLGGPVTGVGLLTWSATDIGSAIGPAIGATGKAAEAWSAVGEALLGHYAAMAQVLPGAFVSPPGGGPVTGLGVLS